MDLRTAGLTEQPFRISGKPLVFVSYEAQQRAHDFLKKLLDHPTGLGLLSGPLLSGKTTLIRSFLESVDENTAVAVVDGAGLNTKALLEALLSQFGYSMASSSDNELINMLKVYLLQQTVSAVSPMLIIENTHAMNPSALRTLCELVELKVRQKSALRLVMVSDRSIDTIIRAPAMQCVLSRLTASLELGPMKEYETTDYLHAKLTAGGCRAPEHVLPENICNELHAAAGGWPGIVDRIVLLALAKAMECPVSKGHIEHPVLPNGGRVAEPQQATTSNGDGTEGADSDPKLSLMQGGETLTEIAMDRKRLIIGRSEHNDLQIDSKYISRHHVMLMSSGGATFLMDLNSTNGTFVNSRRVSNHVMAHNDVISVGNHRIKFIHVAATKINEQGDHGLADTVILKSLEDMRQMLALENTQAMPLPPLKKAMAGDNQH